MFAAREYIVIENLLKYALFQRYFPPLAGLIFIVVFVTLGLWQLDRAAEKSALLDLFESDAPYSHPSGFDSLEEFDRIEVVGRYLAERQILIDNIVRDGRLGYFVITPFQPSANDPLLLVNRGWMPKTGPAGSLPEVSVDPAVGAVQGRVGHLPQVAIRPGEAFAVHDGWPRVGVYPTLDEVSAELGEELLPIVLLLSPDADDGFVRRWQPNTSGPMTHYSYAFQWFVMAAAALGILAWHMRKRLRRD